MTPSAHTADGRRVTDRLTREHIVDRIRRWAELYGDPPVTADWNPSVARWRAQEWRIERYRLGDPETDEPWPSLNAVKRRFDGSFSAAIELAGFEPGRPGPRPRAALTARPDIAQRPEPAPMLPRQIEDVVTAAAEAVRDEARRADDLAKQLRRAEAKAARAEALLADARRRARSAGDRARRAAAARERAIASERTTAAAARAAARERIADAERDADTQVARLRAEARAAVLHAQTAIADADARARAAEDRADAASADAERARGLVRSAMNSDDEQSGLSPAERTALRRAAAPAGPGVLAAALKQLGRARTSGERQELEAALDAIAAAAVGWRDRV